jgi:hypothetical protein
MTITSRERVLRAICHEEPDRIPIFEPYGVLPPTADAVLGRPCVATSGVRSVKLLAREGGARLEKVVSRDWLDLVEKLGFDAGPLASWAHYGPQSPPELIDENSWSIGNSVYRHVPESGVTLEVDSDIRRRGIPAL